MIRSKPDSFIVHNNWASYISRDSVGFYVEVSPIKLIHIIFKNIVFQIILNVRYQDKENHQCVMPSNHEPNAEAMPIAAGRIDTQLSTARKSPLPWVWLSSRNALEMICWMEPIMDTFGAQRWWMMRRMRRMRRMTDCCLTSVVCWAITNATKRIQSEYSGVSV